MMNFKESFHGASVESMGFLLKLLGFALVGLVVLHPSIAFGIGFILLGCYLVRQVCIGSSTLAPHEGSATEKTHG